MPRDLAGQIYGYLSDDEDARVCRDIPAEACNDQPLAFTLQVAAQTLTRLGDALVSARLVFAWMLSALGAPSIFVALLVPVRESLSLLPQLVVAQLIREQPLRKTFWVAGSLVQAGALVAMIPVVWFLTGAAAGGAIILLLAVFSLARGVSSVAAKDVIGKTISKSRRGRLTGAATSIAGVVTLGVVAALLLAPQIGDGAAGPVLFALLLGVAALAWVAAAIVFARVPEVAGATEGGANALTAAIQSLSLLVIDRPFRRFVIARALLTSTALAVPYLVVLIQRESKGVATSLIALLLAEGVAALVSGTFWGRWADRASEHVMAAAALLSVLVMVAAITLEVGYPALLGTTVTAALVLFAASVSHQGARIARKTYLVDMADADNRADYTAVSNSVIGVLLFAGSALALLDSWFGPVAVLALLAVIGSIAVIHCLRLPRVV